jgi:DNA gyrase inhibitor GyrI
MPIEPIGGNIMNKLEVRIVELEPMRVACAHGFGESPEGQASEKIEAFMASKGLKFEDVRWFGFDNPVPSPGSPNYGYDIWITVGPDIEGQGDVVIKEVEGGLYAVTRFKGLDNIGRKWKELVTWFEDSAYKKPSNYLQCLEHLLTPPGTPFDEFVFDLYLPIME